MPEEAFLCVFLVCFDVETADRTYGSPDCNERKKKIFLLSLFYIQTKKGCSSHNISDIKLRKKAVLEAIRSQVALIIKADAIIEQIENLPQQQFGVKILDTQMKALYKRNSEI